MIAKRVYTRKNIKSSFSRLVTYITSGLGKDGRLGEIRITNCANDNIEWVALEVEATQAQNNRSKIDKTYHLLVSFREEDEVSPQTLHILEERICKELGYLEHQRVSAVHHDTDNLHIHIAINKVHPTRFNVHEPYYDQKKLSVLCAALEKEFGLAIDNHTAFRTKAEAISKDMENAAGMESLIGWIKRGCMSELSAATSWDELHNILSRNSLILKERGNGFIIMSDLGIAIKASSLDRNFSRGSLEKKYGKFVPAPASFHPHLQDGGYFLKPMNVKAKTEDLWALYQKEQKDFKNLYALELAKAKKKKEQQILAAKKKGKLKRTAVKLTKGKTAKKILYHTVSKSLLGEINNIGKNYLSEKKTITDKYKSLVWHTWLKNKAAKGNQEALAVLRSRYHRQLQGNIIGTNNPPLQNQPILEKIDNVTNKGTVIYTLGKASIRDDGNQLRLAENNSDQVIERALSIASKKFGKQISLTGSNEFINQATNIAARIGMDIIVSNKQNISANRSRRRLK